MQLKDEIEIDSEHKDYLIRNMNEWSSLKNKE